MLMEKLWITAKKRSFSLTELIFCIFLLGIILPSISMKGHTFLKEWKFKSDVECLKLQLQLANDFVLHCDIPVEVILKQTKKGLSCKLEFENKLLEKKLPTQQFYHNIKQMRVSTNHARATKTIFRFVCSFSGGLEKPLKLSLLDSSKKKELSMIVRGYPHVLEVTK